MKNLRCLGVAMLVALASLMSFAPDASAEVTRHDSMITVSAPSAVVPAPNPSAPNTLPFSLTALAGVVGATASKTRRMNLSQTYLFNGETFGPGTDVEVPADFPDIDDDTGMPIHAEGSVAARNLATSARVNAGVAPVQTGAPGTGAGVTRSGDQPTTVSGMSVEQLEELSKEQLVKIAEKDGTVVTREDGSEGAPLKADYVRVLGATKTD